ncbi:MAG: haloalkane dehalogenase [Candidatus Eremiobacterota bacterium]
MNKSQIISSDFPYESRYVTVNNLKIHYVEAGTGEPSVVLLHGIPVHAYLWRNVIPHISPCGRTVAVDLIGSGKSDKPLDIDYNPETYTEFLKNTFEALNLNNIILVGMDLGLIVGLNYAAHNEGNIRGIVMFEGFFMPADMIFKQMPLSARIIMRLLRIKKIAEYAIVNKGEQAVKDMLTMGMVRKPSQKEIEIYQAPWRDKKVRKKVWLEGTGPNTITSLSVRPGDVADVINRYSSWLRHSTVPKLLLYGEPGSAIRKQGVSMAEKYFDSLQVKYTGKGKHFLPEDEPENIGHAIADFYLSLSGKY